MTIEKFIDKGFYINLDYKTKRNEAMQKTLKDYNLDNIVERIDAVKAFDHTVKCDFASEEWRKCVDSCAKSHLSIIEKAKAENLEKILIFEDDIEFIEDGETPCMEKINSAINSIINIPWDILYLGGVLLDNEINKIDKHLIKINRMSGSHAYILNKNSYDFIINEYHYGYPMDRLLEASLKNKYCVYGCAISQNGDDLSDIGGHQSFGKQGFIDSFDKLNK